MTYSPHRLLPIPTAMLDRRSRSTTKGGYIMSFRLAAAAAVAAFCRPGLRRRASSDGAQCFGQNGPDDRGNGTCRMRLAGVGCRRRSLRTGARFRPGRWGGAAQSRARPPQGLHGADVRADLAGMGAAHRDPSSRASGNWRRSFRSRAAFRSRSAKTTIGGVGLSGAPKGGPQEEACGKAGVAKVADQLK